MKEVELRPYQRECIDVIADKGPGRWLVVMATGLGKTVTFANLRIAGRMLILSHRDELVHQPVAYFDEPVGIEKAEERSDGERIVSASVQTLSRDGRLSRFKPGDFECIVTDEAHHALAPSYRKIIDHLEPRVHIGFTATPNRADGHGLSDVFDEIVFDRDIKWGIVNGYLCDIDCRRVYIKWNTRGCKTDRGDFQVSALDERVNQPGFNEQVAAALRQFGVGQTLVFASSVDHAHALSEHIPGSHVVDGKTPPAERRALIDAFTNREFPVLINYGVFTEGTDLPLIETVLLARPTKNIGLYTQMVGRGLRLSPGKDALRLIDCVGDTRDNSICTAPNLFGFDEGKMSAAAREVVDGRITELEDRILAAEDCPAGWVAIERRVSLFDSDELVAWVRPCNGSLSIDIEGVRIDVEGPDLLGGYRSSYHGRSGDKEVEYKSFEAADRAAFNWLAANPATAGARNLWDAELVRRWGGAPASEKQIEMLRGLLGVETVQSLLPITKREAVALTENARRRQLEGYGERFGRCPTCGAPLKPSSTGTTVQCSSNKWAQDGCGSWALAAGCGFSMPAAIEGKAIPAQVIKELAADRKSTWEGMRYELICQDGRWKVLDRAPALRIKTVAAASALGACPACGAALKVGRKGGTVQCSSNHWQQVCGEWVLRSGCGFGMQRAYKGKTLPDETIRQLVEKRSAEFCGEKLALRCWHGSWRVRGKKEEG